MLGLIATITLADFVQNRIATVSATDRDGDTVAYSNNLVHYQQE